MKERKKVKSESAQSLRERAERLLQEDPSHLPSKGLAELLHELRVHQIELEMQNAELRDAQEKLEDSRNRYYDLYDFAPVGYITMSTSGVILECNLAGAEMFGVVRSRVLGKLFQGFVFPDDLYLFQAHRKRLMEIWRKDTCELKLMKKDKVFYCRIESICARDRAGNPVSLRSALVDINPLKNMQKELEDRVRGRAADIAQANLKLEQQIEKRIKYENALKAATEKIIVEVERRRLLSRRLVQLIEEDRRNIAMALHDHLGQLLTTLNMDLETIENHEEPGERGILLGRARQKVLEAMEFTRNISHELRPSALETLGLVSSLASLVGTIKESSKIDVVFFHNAIPEDLGRAKNLALFRIAQEAITNAVKHAAARQIFINLIAGDGLLRLTIEDDGKGFDQKAVAIAPKGPLGIEIMKERALDAGVQLRIETGLGMGTQVIAEVPV